MFSPRMLITVSPGQKSLRLLVGALLAWNEGRQFVIELVECGSPFRIQGQRDYRAVGIRPLSAFSWQDCDVHVRLNPGLSDVVMVGKSQQRDEMLREWTRGAFCFRAMTR